MFFRNSFFENIVRDCVSRETFKKNLKNSVKTLYFFSEIKYNTNIKSI